MAIDLKGYNGTVVNATSDNELQVALQKDITKVGSVGVVAEVHDGETGVERLVRPIDVSADYRLRVGQDSLIYGDNFSHGNINSSKYKVTVTTHTCVIGSGAIELNGASNTAVGTSVVSTFGSFPLYLSYSLYEEFQIAMTFPVATNNICEFGFGYASASTTPVDGVFFRKKWRWCIIRSSKFWYRCISIY